MKRPEEIKKGLYLCWSLGQEECGNCPYDYLGSGSICIPTMCNDALTLILQLENQIGELTEKVAQLEAAQPKWTEIKDRPPEEKLKKYLVAFQSNGKYVINTAVYNAEFDFMLSHWILGDITHWMYAPKPPKDDDHD